MSTPRKQWCPVCGGFYQPGHPYAAHMRKHVHEGCAVERREVEQRHAEELALWRQLQ